MLITDTLRTIIRARDHNALHGKYPDPPYGPGPDQEFDDWAADVAHAALEPWQELPEKRAGFYRRMARIKYADPSNDDIEVDDDSLCSETDDGVWVQGWLWISKEE